jgi:hypothetical protein
MSRNASRSIRETGADAVRTTRAENSFRYAIDYYKVDGEHLGPISIEPDFQSAREWAYFEGMRSGQLPAMTSAATGRVSPTWCEEREAPYCSGVRIDTTTIACDESVSCEIPKAYFKPLAEHGSAEWVKKGELEPGEPYTYHVCAYPISVDSRETNTREHGSVDSSGFQVEALTDPIPLMESAIESFRSRATAVGKEWAGDSRLDVPLFFSQAVIDEACALATEAGKNETGGVLVGRLHRDPSEPEIFVEVVAQIPAQYAEATGTSFSFSPETWAAADAAIALRNQSELIIGWWHSHPRFCNPECPEERRRACLLAKPFFSSDDIHLHSVCFPQPFQVSLLISDLPDTGATPAVFGWRAGMVSARGYYVAA